MEARTIEKTNVSNETTSIAVAPAPAATSSTSAPSAPTSELKDGVTINHLHKISDNVVVRTGFNGNLLFISAATGNALKTYPEYPNKDPQYVIGNDKYGINEKIRKYFSAYTNNQNAKELYNLALTMNNPPRKFVGSALEEVLIYDDLVLKLRPYKTQNLRPALKQFASDTNAVTFFKENSELYNNMINDFIKNVLNFNHVQRLQEFFGSDINRNKFVIVLSTAMGGGQAYFVRDSDGTNTQYNIMNPADDYKIVLNTLYHETAHSFYDVRMSNQQLLSEYSKCANSLSNEEPDFGTQLNETITRSITAVILEKYHSKDIALHILNNTDRPGGYKNKGDFNGYK